ncbi:MAG: S9 family peptidase [Rhodothermales bacterium]|nr:S9 family peptidase [Rhodothermales bacterium]MBO6778652.1 S9 family peptidase [Rhodothermales bacterium]
MRRFLPLVLLASVTFAATAQQRAMTFMDVQELKRAGSFTPSPDGAWMLYTLSTPNWKEDERQTDVHLVSMAEGVQSDRQLTFTTEHDETSPGWTPDGTGVLFLSDREDSGRQLFLLRLAGGEGQRFTEVEGGVSDYAFSPDGMWLAFRAGEAESRQIHVLPTAGLTTEEPIALTDGEAPAGSWEWAPSSDRIYFIRDDEVDDADRKRRKMGFTVDVRNQVTPASSLWSVDLSGSATHLAGRNGEYSVEGFTLSDDGAWIGIRGGSLERYERNITGQFLYADAWLMEVATGNVERLTDNFEVSESGLMFSPDGRWVAFSAPDDLTRYTMTENRLYVREVGDAGGAFRKLGSDFDNSVRGGFWSEDGSTMYFTAGVKVTNQLHAIDIATGRVQQVTNVRGSLFTSRDEDSGRLMLNYADPETPSGPFTVASLDDITNQDTWIQLVEPNPQLDHIARGHMVEVEWTSSDGKTVGGVLTYPVGYQEGTRYPLVVDIHGGPASADLLRFDNNANVYAGAGYVHFQPNYRGSRNYGNAHRTDIVGDYFTMGYEDIMSGVDHLIDEGIVDGDRMGAFGWSAGGHWSNWILTQTDRFKAISSGAGTMNWISMYAQSDVQRNRRFYIGDDFLYENFEPYWDQSPLKYIANAKTPTMVHVVEGDPRVPSPQSVELHMALKKLGVPTELFMYPGRSHGIPDARNRLVKSVSEMAWMDYYVRGIGEKFEWEMVLETLEEEAGAEEEVEPEPATSGS